MMPELSILITRRGSSKNHGRGFGGGEGRLKLKSRITYGSSISFEYQRRRGHRIAVVAEAETLRHTWRTGPRTRASVSILHQGSAKVKVTSPPGRLSQT